MFAWPLVSIAMFARMRVESAAIWSLLAGYLLLPSATTVDVALLPPLDKYSIPAISTFLLCWMKGTQAPAPARSPWIYFLAFVFVVTPIFTSLSNSYELQIGDRSIQGFYPADGLKLAARNLFTLAPFFVGMRFLSTDNGRALLLRAIVAAGLLYSLPVLFEIRFSPILHSWVYGFFPSSYVQAMRNGGFRAVVFLRHGLEVALFLSLVVIGALVSARAKWRVLRVPGGAAAGYLSVVLLLCKSMGSILYAVFAAPLVLLTGPKTWVRIASVMLLVVAFYPFLRTYDLIPVHRVIEAAKNVSDERSSSFQTRVENEDRLLAKGNEKPLFGWGTWGRNRVYDQSGGDITITDGEWIIDFGMFGWAGYLSLFGLFATAALRSRRAVRGPVTEAKIVLGGLTLILGVNVFDLIPNAALLPFTYLVAGSIAARSRARVSRPLPKPRMADAREPAVVGANA